MKKTIVSILSSFALMGSAVIATADTATESTEKPTPGVSAGTATSDRTPAAETTAPKAQVTQDEAGTTSDRTPSSNADDKDAGAASKE